MAGRTASNAVTRYAGIQVQSSSLGLQIPVGWGTFRCKCNLVDYLDFASKAQKAASGKGGVTTGYSYSATIILAICEGPVDAISTVYVDGKVYVFGSPYSGNSNTGTGTALAQAGLSWSTGAIGQTVWSYLTSKHPAHAIGYSGLTIAYAENYPLDSGASTPNHSFEIVRQAYTVVPAGGGSPQAVGVSGTADCDPSLMLTDFFQNTRTGVPLWGTGLISASAMTQYQDYCLAAGLLLSPVIDSQRAASDFINEVLLATNATCVWSEGLLKMLPYGDVSLTSNGKTFTPNNTPVYLLTDDAFIVDSAEPPVSVDIMDQSDAYNCIQLEYLDRTNQYNMAIAFASDAANVAQYGRRLKDPDTVHVICTPAVAAAAAQLWLQRTLYVRAQYKFKLSWSYALLEPGDIVEITDAGLGLTAYPVRIIQIDEDEKAILTITAEDAMIGIASSPLYTMQGGMGAAANTAVDPGGVEANLLLQSGNLALSPWQLTDASIASNVATDQYDLTTADALVPNTSNTSHYVTQSVAAFAGLNYTFSVCLQKNAHKIARVYITDASFVDGVFIDVDLNAGDIFTAAQDFGAGVLISARMSATLVSGIWQIVLTAQVPSATTLYGVVASLSDAGALTWTGDSSDAINVSQPALWQGLDDGRAYAATTTALAGPVIFNPPAVASDGATVMAAVAGGPLWGGAFVWTSIDGTNYQQIGAIEAPARFGVLTSGLNQNLLYASSDISNTSEWFHNQCTVTSGISDPFGGTAAQALAASTTNSNIYIQQNNTYASANQTYTMSVWIKAGTLSGNCFFGFKDGASANVIGTTITPTSTWTRYTVTGTFPSGATAGVFTVINPSNTTNTSGQTMLFYGPQLELTSGAGNYSATTQTNLLAWATDPDTKDTISVDLGASSGELTSASDATADNGGTLCLIDSELVCFSTATLTNPDRYNLTGYIRRGYLNTAVASHAAGASLIRLDGEPFEFPYFATNVGQAISVKFQSFNIYGLATQSLSDCNAYSVTPNPAPARAPSSSAWTAIGTTISNAGVSTAALLITGASDNPSATAIVFYFRVTGQTAWQSAGQHAPSTASYPITNGIASGQTYDVAVAYIVAGLEGAKQIIASAITAGASISGYAPGSAVVNLNTTGAFSGTLPAGSYGHVDVVLTGLGGTGYLSGGGKGFTEYGASGASVAIYANIAVTPGVTTYSGLLAAAVGTASTFAMAGVSLSAPSGINATSSGAAAAPSNATGGTQNEQGHAGGLTNSYSGGGAWQPTNAATNVTSGGYADQNSGNQPGNVPGGGSSGSPAGGGANLLMIARA